MKKWIIVTSMAVLTCIAHAQDKIETDRPTEAQSAQLVSKGSVQAEVGFRKEQQDDEAYTIQHPNLLVRIGILNRLEFRLASSFETEHVQNSTHGLKPLEAGVKLNVFQAKDTSFTATLYSHIGIPGLASEDFKTDHAFYRVRLLFENKLTEKLKLNYNVGREWNDNEQQQSWMYAVSPQLDISDKWKAFAEEYAFIEKSSRPEHYIDAGLAYLVNDRLQLDIDAGKGLTSKSSDYFITAGVSVKF